MKKIAFVLGGGSIKGAYQIGQMHTLIHNGIIPNIITGISVGSLNGLLYSHYLGLYNDPILAIDNCVGFWINNIKKPSDIIKKKSIVKIIYEIMSNKFTGLLATVKLESLVTDVVDTILVKAANVDLDVGAVNMNTGLILYFNKTYDKIKECTIASSRIPLMMPPSILNNEEYYDGGLIDNAALGKAIDKGADEIRVLTTIPERIKIGFNNTTSLLSLVNRVMEITVNNTLNNDVNLAKVYNSLSSKGLSTKRFINLHIYRPKETLDIDIEDFTSVDIQNMISKGKQSIFF